MRITELRTVVVGTPWRQLTLVEVHTDEGLTGVGETRMIGHTDALLGYLAEAEHNQIRGRDPFDVEALVQGMHRIDYGRSGEIAMSALAVVEMACWDIVGQALGQPVYVLVAPHNVCGPIATAANLHLAACTPNFTIQEHFNDFADSWVLDLAPGLPAVDPQDGCFALPTAPGLGVRIDWDAVADHPREDVHFDLFTPGWERRDARVAGPPR